MALDIANKDYSPGQIQISVWDETDNALRVKTVSGGGGGGVAVNQQLFWDDGANGVFIRNYVTASDGSFDSFYDTDIDGAAYTILGSITSLEEIIYYETQTVANAVVAGVNETAYHDYSSVNVTTAAYVELVASTSAAIKQLEIFDSSGQLLVLALGPATSEVDLLYITPGGNGLITQAIPVNTRISIKAVSANATAGFIAVNLLA